MATAYGAEFRAILKAALGATLKECDIARCKVVMMGPERLAKVRANCEAGFYHKI